MPLGSFHHRVLNYIDIDCGPVGQCPDHATRARSFPSFRAIFEAAWKKTTSRIEAKIAGDDDVDVGDFLVKRCSNKTWPTAYRPERPDKKGLICQASFFIHLLSKDDFQKAEDLKRALLKNLFDQSLFKEVSLKELNGSVVYELESSLKNGSYEMFDWNLKDRTAIKMAAKFYFELSAITYRVTKLGTLMVWSDSYHHVADFFKTILGKLDGDVQSGFGPDDLMKVLSPKSFTDLRPEEIERVKILDSNSSLCRGVPEEDQHNCCQDNTTCGQVSIKTVMRIMKDGMFHPHALEIDSRLENFTGTMSDGSYPLQPPSYLTEDLIGFKLIGPDSFKDQKLRHRHFLTPEPLIPFCKISDAW